VNIYGLEKSQFFTNKIWQEIVSKKRDQTGQNLILFDVEEQIKNHFGPHKNNKPISAFIIF
jgi:hypothetical protein